MHEKKGRPAAVEAVGAAAATPTHLTGSGFASGCHCCWPGFRLSFQLYALCIRMHVCVCVFISVGAYVCACLRASVRARVRARGRATLAEKRKICLCIVNTPVRPHVV